MVNYKTLSIFIIIVFLGVFLYWALLLLLFFQHSAKTQTSFNLLLPGSQQGKLYPPWGLCLLPCQPPEALAPFHGHVVPKPQRFSNGRSLQPGVGLLPGRVGCRQALSPRHCGGGELERGLDFLLTHFILHFRWRPFAFHTGLKWYDTERKKSCGRENEAHTRTQSNWEALTVFFFFLFFFLVYRLCETFS